MRGTSTSGKAISTKARLICFFRGHYTNTLDYKERIVIQLEETNQLVGALTIRVCERCGREIETLVFF